MTRFRVVIEFVLFVASILKMIFTFCLIAQNIHQLEMNFFNKIDNRIPNYKHIPISILERFSFECRKAIGFAFCTPHDCLKKLAPRFHPIRSKTKTNPDSLERVFHLFASASCNYFEFWLVHWIVCVLCELLWLARVIKLVLALRHSIENRSNYPTNELYWLLS